MSRLPGDTAPRQHTQFPLQNREPEDIHQSALSVGQRKAALTGASLHVGAKVRRLAAVAAPPVQDDPVSPRSFLACFRPLYNPSCSRPTMISIESASLSDSAKQTNDSISRGKGEVLKTYWEQQAHPRVIKPE
jgi:hypothetical protein